MQLPNGFTAIKDATSEGQSVNLIGILVAYDGPKSSKGLDHVLSFTIQDDFADASTSIYSSINGRMFKPPNKFPKISGLGDIIILRNAKLKQWNGRMECIGDRQFTHMTVFPSNMIPVPELSHAFQAGSQKLPCDSSWGASQPTIPEQMAVIHLKHASSGSGQQIRQHVATAAFNTQTGKRDYLIKDLQFNTFANIRAQVVNIYHYHGQVDLKVTDYTPNESMFYYADPEKEDSFHIADRHWKGPYGYLTLSVTLYEENANWAREHLAIGDYVFIRNMRVKLSARGKLEGVVHQDKVNKSQVDIRSLKSASEIAEIDNRRREYESKRGGGVTAFEKIQSEAKKPSAKTSHNKKLAKRERQRVEKEAEQQEIEKKAREWEASRSGVNTNIRCAHVDMKSSTISEIIHNPHLRVRTLEKCNDYELPFVNCRYRSRVRVIDVFPPKLELFAHSLNDPNWTKRSGKQHADNTCPKERWEWGFVLLLEDAEVPRGGVSEKLRVVVNNSSAQYLLKLNAQDLKNNPKVLRQLEQKLFLLWGNLMELKTELRAKGSDLPLPPGDNRLQNKPFDTCIEEYGCEVPVTEDHPFGYQRMHNLVLTTIMD
ncbi:hypothetical protein COCVIDRAFT_101107 [Bipolaris victoriae FI3]|uniref:Protection of telomeres protein 1 n=1 Tax=Bipolaris victoriae (strain FI3) TaxID=930091 RepID=W7EHR2_BIPV3|nr:hypothetical protein COCVIDRAFT_101107 [Bipolaris victoriae FI3]